MQRRKLEELSLMDDFLFNAMLTHSETGEKFTNKILKLLFNREFKNLKVSAQKVYAGMNTDLRGDRVLYTIKNRCLEEPEMNYDDGAETIVLYTKGTKGTISEGLRQFLNYMENTDQNNAVNEDLKDIQKMVDVVKRDGEVSLQYMKSFEHDQLMYAQGEAAGREDGLRAGRLAEIKNTEREKKRADMAQSRIKQVILLIDEYDVPLDKAFQYGYYDEMVSLLRNMFGNALKTNPNLYFAVLTGCLRISKESIFTGLNNLKVLTLTDVRFDEYFGFTDTEVKGMLEYYGLSGHYAEVKEWYDGYRFGNVEVYCPWDVINYCDLLRADPNALPQDYWSNTSGNAMVRRFIDKADTQTRDEIERLIAGDEILKEIHQELTYNELDSSIEVMLG